MTGPIASSNASNREMVDTNVLVYAVDPSSGGKHRRATALLHDLADRDTLAVSAQVLNEFYSVVTRKKGLLSHEQAVRYMQTIAGSSVILPLTLAGTLLAVDGVALHDLSFWDALI